MKKVLIANRGEIACRIIRTLKEMSIASVAVYSTADKDSLHVKLADEAVCIGGPKSKDSYLKISSIIAACEISGADAVHPGYGFLSEDPVFAEIVEKSNLLFIGPTSKMIKKLGNKIHAKRFAQEISCPTIPGSKGSISSVEEGIQIAKEIGFPVCIKASDGGGGKAIRIIECEKDFEKGFIDVKTEAKISFSSDEIYLEKMIVNPRHIEVQIAADMHGTVIHLYDRDCSIQRKRQKLVEESGELTISKTLREKMLFFAKKLIRKANYYSLATVEFLVEGDHSFYFMEVNTRIQVEHTITEELLGIDLVALQIEIALKQALKLTQKDIVSKGHVIEFRINAEDPMNDFISSSGKLETFLLPLGSNVRIETYLYQGMTIVPFYDSMIGKIIVKGETRKQVLNRSKRVLKECMVEGIKTTIPFFLSLLENELFINNTHHIFSIDMMKQKG